MRSPPVLVWALYKAMPLFETTTARSTLTASDHHTSIQHVVAMLVPSEMPFPYLTGLA